MKRYTSLLMLYARQSAPALLAILLLLGAVQTVLFVRADRRTAAEGIGFAASETGVRTELFADPPGPETVLRNSGVRWALLPAFLLLSAALCLTNCSFGSRCGDTLARLRLTPRAQRLLQALYNGLCYLALWGFETGLLWLLCARWCARAPEANAMTLPLAFWRDGLLHALLPLAEWPLWVRNGLLLAALSLASAAFPVLQRRSKPALGMLFLAALTCGCFVTEVGLTALDAALILVSVLLILYYGYLLLFREEVEINDGEALSQPPADAD